MTNKPCIIILRPEEDAADTAALLAKHGFVSFIEPIFSTQYCHTNKTQLLNAIADSQGIVVTSKNAIKAMLSMGVSTHLPLITLGKNTTNFASTNGFNALFAGNNLHEVKEYIKENFSNKHLAYASGEEITEELSFKNCHANIQRIIIYKTIPKHNLSEKFTQHLRKQNFAAILFFSNNSVNLFNHLLTKANLSHSTKDLYAFCLSDKIKSAAEKYGFRATISAENANSDAIIQALIDFPFA